MVFALELKLSKTLRGLVYFVLKLWGGFDPCISTVQNTQASPDFLTLPQFIPTCYKCYKRKKTFITLLR